MKRAEYTHGLVDTGAIMMLRLCDGVRSLMRMFGNMLLSGSGQHHHHRGGGGTTTTTASFVPNHDMLSGKVVDLFQVHTVARYDAQRSSSSSDSSSSSAGDERLLVESLYFKSVLENLFDVLFCDKGGGGG